LKKSYFILLILLFSQLAKAQERDSSKLVMGIIQGNDTIITVRVKKAIIENNFFDLFIVKRLFIIKFKQVFAAH